MKVLSLGQLFVMKNPRKLKNTIIFTDEDFCPETMENGNQLWEEVKKLHMRCNIAYRNYPQVVSK